MRLLGRSHKTTRSSRNAQVFQTFLNVTNPVTFKNITFRDTTFGSVKLPKATFEYVTFVDSFFNRVVLNGATFNGSNFEGVAWECSEIDGLTLRDVHFFDSTITGSKMRSLDAYDVYFDALRVFDTDLRGIRNLSGHGSTQTRLSGANLDGVSYSLLSSFFSGQTQNLFGGGGACVSGNEGLRFAPPSVVRALTQCPMPPKEYLDCWGDDAKWPETEK